MQTSPVAPHDFLLNIDLMASPGTEDSFHDVLDTQKAVLGATEAVVDPKNLTGEDLLLIHINSDYLQRGQF